METTYHTSLVETSDVPGTGFIAGEIPRSTEFSEDAISARPSLRTPYSSRTPVTSTSTIA